MEKLSSILYKRERAFEIIEDENKINNFIL